MALLAAAKILNNVHTKAVYKTPYELWTKKKLYYAFLRVWGCPAYVKYSPSSKLDSRSILCYFVRYPSHSTGYLSYHPADTKIIVSRNAAFLEEVFLFDGKGKTVNLDEIRETQREVRQEIPQVVVEHVTTHSIPSSPSETQQNVESAAPDISSVTQPIVGEPQPSVDTPRAKAV